MMGLRNVWFIAFVLGSCSCQNVWVDQKNPRVGKCYFRKPTTLQRMQPDDLRPGEVKLFLEKGRDFSEDLENGRDSKPTTEVRELKRGCIFKLNRVIVSEAGVGTMVEYEMLAMNKDCEVDHYYLGGFYADCNSGRPSADCELGKSDMKEVPCPR